MKYQSIEPCDELCPFVKNILVFKGEDNSADTNLPFFADGFPGMLYHNADRLAIAPHQKEFPGLFIYGQTIRPIEIHCRKQPALANQFLLLREKVKIQALSPGGF